MSDPAPDTLPDPGGETGADEELVVAEPGTPRRRRCVAGRSSHDPRTMLRFVVDPGDHLVFDADERLPGRGLWLSADREVVKKALARQLFAKAARRRVLVDDDLPATLETQLHGRCLQWLGLAKRAGQIEVGFEQVERAAREGHLAALVIALDAGNDGAGKLERFGLPTLRAFSSQDMGRALGRSSLVYVGLRPGRLADRLQTEASKLLRLRGQAEPVEGPPMAKTPADPTWADAGEETKASAFVGGERGRGRGPDPRG
ncbi:MAG: DUF448 domain-containing protein [Geminicoccaceae bacterium]|nr:MAG: DUF448 domain-containing protein [Geminicoccaceae bacterium]